jgi:hypothetical protein
MINRICVVYMPLPIRSVSQRTRRSLDPTLRWITRIILFVFNSEFKFVLIYESNFHVTGFSYGPTTYDVVWRVSHSRVASNVASAASRWILDATAFRPEFQHSLPLSGHRYWLPPPWAPPTGGEVPSWGLAPLMTSTPQLQ